MRKKILYAFAVNIFVMFLMAVMFTTSEKTDDYVMKLILSGAMSGTPDAHLLYVNFFLGKTLEILTKFVPQVSWMEVSQIGTVFLSLTIFTIFMQDEEKPAQSWAAILPVIIFFGYEGYMKITFTKTAGIAMGVGMLLLCYAFLQKKTWKCYETVCGALLFLLGTMFRSKMLNAAILIFGGILLIHYFPEFWRNKGKARWKLILRPVLGAVLLFVLAKSVS
ncbi:MAG: hypothetical protein IIY75_09905, partial [Erysipelotrichales bacterium]|nr:hypothetical protein [Erysipelotrichales bacterium]